jgi:hypothetical protein
MSELQEMSMEEAFQKALELNRFSRLSENELQTIDFLLHNEEVRLRKARESVTMAVHDIPLEAALKVAATMRREISLALKLKTGMTQMPEAQRAL